VCVGPLIDLHLQSDVGLLACLDFGLQFFILVLELGQFFLRDLHLALRQLELLLRGGVGELLLRLLGLQSFFHQLVEVFAAQVAVALVRRVHELLQLVLVEVLPDDHVVGDGPVLVAQVQLLHLGLDTQQLLPHVVHVLVLLLARELRFAQNQVGLQICVLHLQRLVFEGESVRLRLLHLSLHLVALRLVRLKHLRHASLEHARALGDHAFQRRRHGLILLGRGALLRARLGQLGLLNQEGPQRLVN
jgi:hypothetical protein